MKKLIYIWVNNYKNTIIQQGYQLSPEILVRTEALSVKETGNIELFVHMTDNRSNVAKNFYGQNISSVMAFVGKNGSGKTMVSRMLLEYLPDGLMSNDSINNPEFLQSLGLVSEWDNRVLYVLYDDEKDVVSVCPNHVMVNIQKEWGIGGIEFEKISQDKIYHELSSAVKTGIYLTNVFNPAELLESYHKLDLGDGVVKFQQTYSPALLLKHESEEQTKSLYGYHSVDNKFIKVIQRYAQSQMSSLSFAFINKQAELFLKSFYHIPEKLKDELHVYQEFGLEVIEFGTQDEVIPYVYSDGSFNELYQRQDLHDQILIYLKKIYISKKDEMEKNVLVLLYFNMLLEVYGVFYCEDSNIKQEIEKLLNGRITDIDVEILNSIKEYLSKNELQSSDWANQILEFIDFLLDSMASTGAKNWMGKTGNRSFDEKEFLEWYYNEITKETSFVKRNLIFRWKPTSSGEVAIANLFAYLDDAIQNLKIKESNQNVLLILDELDCYLHPKWQQYIVNIIFDRLQEYTKCMFQVVITSHSPIILSDICNGNILKLDKLEAKLETKKTFGADISHLYYDSFFMDEGDIGDFAKQKIRYAIEELKKERLTEEEKILFIIENIGQDIVREKLRGKYQVFQHQKQLRTQEANSMEMAERIYALDVERRKKVLNYISEMENL
ncbi:MAG: AAA family ATPase [Lachnospiraceae bacterium]|nr:AAA family ATPase [Lachnospiraceae bacterium]